MWFSSLFARTSHISARQRPHALRVRQRTRSFRPLLEILEDRTVPSTLTVTNNLDTGVVGDGSLRGEIAVANSGDTIKFAASLAGQTISLTRGELAITKSVDIEGLGANQLTISANGYSRVFDITGSTTDVQIRDLTIAYGFGLGGGIYNSGALTVSNSTLSKNNGGGIYNSGVLTVSNSTLSGNMGGDSGGGIYNSGALTVSNSTLSGNTVTGGGYGDLPSYGGAIYMAAGRLSVSSSTISNNIAFGGSFVYVPDYGDPFTVGGDAYGGGLYVAGGTVSIDHSTFAGNQAIAGYTDPAALLFGYSAGFGYGGGIVNYAGGQSALQVYDTILAGNVADYNPDLWGGSTSLGHNLVGNSTGGSGFTATDLLNVDPQLAPLQNNGGPTQTMALLAGSRAIDAGDNTGAPAYDQRGTGFLRIVNGVIDIGAFEVQNGSSSQARSLAVAGFPSVTTAGVAGSFTVTAKNTDGTTATSYTGTVHFTSSDGQASLPADYTFTAADGGVHTFSATLKTAGTQSITAADATTFGLTGTDGGITMHASAASTMTVGGFPTSTTAGVAGSFAVTLKDAYGNIASGYTGTVQFKSSDGKASLPANYTFTAADVGVHTFSATLKTAGIQSLTVTDTATGGLSGSEAGIAVNPAAASQFIITAPASVTASVPFSLTVTIKDAYGNVVTGYNGTIHLRSTDSKATLPANYTFTASDKGVHAFTGLALRKKGNQTITITDTLNSSLTASVMIDVL